MNRLIVIVFIVSSVFISSCKKEQTPPSLGEYWQATVRYESTVKKLPATLVFHSGSVSFEKHISARPTDEFFVWDTAIVLHQFDSIYYEMQYNPPTCDHHYTNNMFVHLTGAHRQITEVGFASHYVTHVILKGRVRSVSANYYSKP